MPEQYPWLEPIRTAAAAVAANPPPLIEWEAGEDEGEVVDPGTENLLQELGWPTRTKTFTTPTTVLGCDPPRSAAHEHTERYFPGSWLDVLTNNVAKYVQARDAGQTPTVPDQLRLRKLPQGAGFDAFRDLIEGAWDHAWDELACSVAIMCPYDAMGMDHLRWNLAIRLWYGPPPRVDLGIPATEFDAGEPLPSVGPAPTYEGRLRDDEEDLFPMLRSLPSPKWRAWFLDTWNDRVAIHEALEHCGIEVTEQLDIDLQRARYAIDADATQMTIEELVNRVEARHRLFVSAFRAARDSAIKDEPGGHSGRAELGPRRTSNRPPAWDAIMEMVGRLKGENTRWKEIREQVEKAHGYRCDSEEALRKHFERWQKGQKPPG